MRIESSRKLIPMRWPLWPSGHALHLDIAIRTVFWIAMAICVNSCAKRVTAPVVTLPPTTPVVAFDTTKIVPRAKAFLAQLFQLGLYVPPAGTSPTNWPLFAQSGMMAARVSFYTPYDYHDWLSYLDAAQAVGMQVALAVGEEIFTPSAGTSLVTPQIASHPALLCMVLADEPVWNITYRGWTGFYGASKAKWLAGVAMWKSTYPQVKLCSVDPYVMHDIETYPEAAALIAEYYQGIDIPIVGDYGASYWEHKYMVDWMRNLTGKNPWTIIQGFAPAPAWQLDAWVSGSKDGGALGAFWWSWPEGFPNATPVTSQLWADIVAVTHQYGEQPHPPLPARRVWLPLVIKQ